MNVKAASVGGLFHFWWALAGIINSKKAPG